ncbi:LLM class flavin-dependent oxidoreductase [Aquamicrobium sp. LC103]|uniref:LLM class flavin-dependent oxidoreductase n=1 Tax=Aquamicrobium sp. LC103 TaxID=1120658 RepID=UPI00063E89AD|nr:LLM class flavin-dependent oxidoreductase [Aquamicrobium sp. LC103]TKT74985.1 LLM class flavin-dependent oxidoreductase [Aquamicrobium sp. LC103]
MEIGLYTFADVGTDPVTGKKIGPSERLRNLVEEIELADQVGLDVFGLGEHHRSDYAVSSPAVALAAAATRTKRIRLSSAVSVLSSDDPIRVFQQFSTLDNLSEGRAEIMAGRGSFIESFPLFGYDLGDYDTLFAEKLELLMKLNEGERVTWPGGQHTQPINERGVYPRPYQEKLPIWIAVGGTPQSVARAGVLGLPLALAIIGGEPARFAPLFDLYRRAAAQSGHDAAKLATSINVHGFVGETTVEAADTFYAPQAEVMNRIGRERGWGPTNRDHFDQSRGPRGALFVGSPAEVTDKILANHEVFGFSRFLIQMAIGVMDHAKLMKAIELLGTKVAPEVRKATANKSR